MSNLLLDPVFLDDLLPRVEVLTPRDKVEAGVVIVECSGELLSPSSVAFLGVDFIGLGFTGLCLDFFGLGFKGLCLDFFGLGFKGLCVDFFGLGFKGLCLDFFGLYFFNGLCLTFLGLGLALLGLCWFARVGLGLLPTAVHSGGGLESLALGGGGDSSSSALQALSKESARGTIGFSFWESIRVSCGWVVALPATKTPPAEAMAGAPAHTHDVFKHDQKPNLQES